MQLLPLQKTSYPVSPTCQIPNLANKFAKIFGRRPHGFFVEVGAYDGESYSNTSCLADVGWSGIYIEPVAEYAASCRSRHKNNPKVKTLGVAASDHEGEMTLYTGGVLSTLIAEQVDDYAKVDWSKNRHHGEQTVRVSTLDNILRENGAKRRFDLLSVDVEGYEFEVFKGFDINFWRPRAIIVELEDEHPDFRNNLRIVSRALKVRQMLQRARYELFYKDHINSIYTRKNFALPSIV